jgi:hypothetical protein
MNAVRKIIGLLLIIFFGLPTLFGIIWAVGMVRASVSPEFLTDLPRKIIADLPSVTDEIFRDAQNEENISDPNTRAWFRAAAQTGISPRELMEKTGLSMWMEGELSDSLRQIGMMLRGERRIRSIVINLRPLKEALLHPEVDRFLEETLNNLPPCDASGLEKWGELAIRDYTHFRLPACRPDLPLAKEVLASKRAEAVRDMDNEIEVFEGVHYFPFHSLGLSRMIGFFSYFLFLIPAAFIFLGAIIADSSPSGFLRWSGVSIMVGGIPALVLALMSKYVSLWALSAMPYSWHTDWSSELGDLVLDKLRWIPTRVVDQLFSPVIGVAAIVCVVGIVLLALSFSARGRAQKSQAPVSPSAPASPKTSASGTAQPSQPTVKESEPGEPGRSE